MIGVEFVKDRATREPAPEIARAPRASARSSAGSCCSGPGRARSGSRRRSWWTTDDVDTALAMIDGLLGELD